MIIPVQEIRPGVSPLVLAGAVNSPLVLAQDKPSPKSPTWR